MNAPVSVRTLFRSFAVVPVLSLILSAQEIPPPPVEWGEIPKEDLEMKSFPADTNAGAVVLCDYGETTVDDDINLVFRRHTRVKILSQRGFDWATHAVTIRKKDPGQVLDDLEGVTYTLAPDGSVQTTELDDDQVFKESLPNNRVVYKFTMPAVTPGCIIEYRYVVRSESIFDIDDWVFQRDEPVRWSEYRVKSPRNIAYVFVKCGYQPFAVEDRFETTQHVGGRAASYMGENLVRCNFFRWAVKDAPALRDEPFVTTLHDYANAVDVQLGGYSFIGTGVQKILNTWEKLTEDLMDIRDFGKEIDVTSHVREAAAPLVQGVAGDDAKIRAIHRWIQSTIVVTENRVFGTGDLDDVLKNRKGNSADVNFLLIAMLRAVGIEADPVIVSTRDNGVVQKLYPIANQFNRTVTRALGSNGTVILDPTSSLRPWNIVPSSMVNVQGLVVKGGREEWVKVTTNARWGTTSLTTIRIAEDGSLTGTVSGVRKEYAAISGRASLRDDKEEKAARNILDLDNASIVLDSIVFAGKDSLEGPLTVTAKISSNSYAQSVGEFIYINPLITGRLKENPLKLAERKFPVDYGYLHQRTDYVHITIPEGYEIKGLPVGRTIGIRGEKATWSRQVSSDGREIQIRLRTSIDAPVFYGNEYNDLREFYATCANMEGEQIVLQKKQTPPPAPAPPPAKQSPPKKSPAAKKQVKK